MSAPAVVEVDVTRLGLQHSFHAHVPVFAAELVQGAVATQLQGAPGNERGCRETATRGRRGYAPMSVSPPSHTGVYILRGRPVRRVTVLGVVVEVSSGPKFTSFGGVLQTRCSASVSYASPVLTPDL
jgi:hypothetical protein